MDIDKYGYLGKDIKQYKNMPGRSFNIQTILQRRIVVQRKILGSKKLQSWEMKEFQIDGTSFLLIHHKEKYYDRARDGCTCSVIK